jgi:hypothetical protein
MSAARLSAAALATAALLAGCGGHAPTPGAIQTLDPNNLPKLPDQGLLVAQHGGVLLVDLDGRVYGRLAGYLPYPGKEASRDGLFAKSVGIQALQQADPGLAIFFDRAGRGWLLDAGARRLRRLDRLEVGLAGNAKLVAVVTGNGTSGVSTTLTVRRAGSTLLTGDLSVVGTRYVASANFASDKPAVLLDLVTGDRWKLKAQCAAAGVLDGKAIAACQTPNKGDRPRRGRLYAFAPDGSSRVLATYTIGLYVESAALSPDSRWLLLYLAPGCGPGWAAVAPSTGGPARLVTADGLVPSKGALPTSRFSSGLGWTRDNRIVADISGPSPSDCEHESGSGTFVIDPASLARTRAHGTRAFALWNATVGE